VNTRDKILAAIASGKPPAVTIPEPMPAAEKNQEARVSGFMEMLQSIGGHLIRTADYDLIEKDLSDSLARVGRIVNTVPRIGPVNDIEPYHNAVDLSSVEKAYLKSTLGVAENGAVWLAEKDMMNRLLPFICQHLVVILEESNIVSDMHAAYSKIKNTDAGFHLFLAGPSKTADIDQSLVIGAHGARSLLVYLISGEHA